MNHSAEWIIGAAESCDLVVDEPTVSSHHCRLTIRYSRLQIEDLGSTNGAFVGGRRISGITNLAEGETLGLGTSIEVSGRELQSLARTSVIRIGRDPDNDVVIDRPSISGHHARRLVDRNQITIIDLKSTNGTSVGRPDNKATRRTVSPEDVLFFGSERVAVTEILDNVKRRETDNQWNGQTRESWKPIVAIAVGGICLGGMIWMAFKS